MLSKREARDSMIEWCKKYLVKVTPVINSVLEEYKSAPLNASVRLVELIRRPGITVSLLRKVLPALEKRINEIEEGRREEILESVEILIKYEGYINREAGLAEKARRLEYVRIPADMDFNSISSLSIEARQKLSRIRPATIGQASRILGVSPADVNILLVLLGR